MTDDHDEISITEAVNEGKVKVIQNKSEQERNRDIARSLFIRRLVASYAENKVMDSGEEQ